MEIMEEVSDPDKSKPHRSFCIYALRLARLCYLRHLCPKDHPVLITELHLVEIAQSKLREYILSNYSLEEIQMLKPSFESEIKQIARNKIKNQLIDWNTYPDTSDTLKSIDDFDLNAIFQG
jgi:hypothetical protein